MVKAQSFFGAPDPKDKASKVRQVGNTGSAGGGGTNITRKTNVKQVGTHHGSPGNSQQVRDSKFTTRDAGSRPHVPGKVDNREKGL